MTRKELKIIKIEMNPQTRRQFSERANERFIKRKDNRNDEENGSLN